jgi:hypothetical protein
MTLATEYQTVSARIEEIDCDLESFASLHFSR